MLASNLVTIYMVAFAVLMALILYYVQGKMALKVSSVAVFFFIASSIYFSFNSYKGWPAETQFTGKAEVLWIDVAEGPTDEESSIFVWLKSGDLKYKKEIAKAWFDPRSALAYDPQGYPRAFRLPYTKEGAKFADKAKRAIKEGGKVTLEIKEEGESELKDGEESNGKKGGSGQAFTLGRDDTTGVITNQVDGMQKE